MCVFFPVGSGLVVDIMSSANGNRGTGVAGSSVIRKAVIPAAGLGTRLLSVTKEQPKEMLPVFARRKNGELWMKQIVQLVFEQLY